MPVPVIEGPVIELDSLSVRLAGKEILKSLSCRLGGTGRGRAIGLLGPNGAGKSTLIQTLLGFHRPASGSARVLGFDCHRETAEVKRRIGYMPETDSLIAEMPAISFLRLMAELSGLPSGLALEKSHEVLFHVGLGEARYRALGTYSLGMRQMAKLAQAIVHGPELVILDEPTNGLDPAARRRMLSLVREMKESHGMSIVVCTHLLRDVEDVCEEAVILKAGEIVHHADLEAERQSNRRLVELEVIGDDHALAEALSIRAIEAVNEGQGRWRLVLPPGFEIGGLWSMLAALRLRVNRLTHRRDSLEEIFLKAVGHLPATPAESPVTSASGR